MTFKPMNTADDSTALFKSLLYAHHGWGKTTQAKYFQKRFGPGFILSGEAGLASVRKAGIDYLPFTSWDGEHDHSSEVYSFKGLCRDIASADFRSMNYKWIMIDSLTELADLCGTHVQKEQDDKGSKNGFEYWENYANNMLGACKWVRDLPYHVIVTALAKEEEDDDGQKHYWPMIRGSRVQKGLPGIFDNVFCGTRATAGKKGEKQRVIRYLITDEVKGWHGKVRDENQRLRPVERCDDVSELLARMQMPESDFEEWLDKMKTREQTDEQAAKEAVTDE